MTGGAGFIGSHTVELLVSSQRLKGPLQGAPDRENGNRSGIFVHSVDGVQAGDHVEAVAVEGLAFLIGIVG